MVNIYLTIDTEYSAGLFGQSGNAGRADNFARSIQGRTAGGDVGIFYQMDVLDRHGLKGIFFVDPMPALIWGIDCITDIVKPIIARGHDVQLHIHTEWLEFTDNSPLHGRTGRNMKDFSLEDQSALILLANEFLMAAGAPAPIAFRAGNYGANSLTLRALAMRGLQFDTSFSSGNANGDCAITLPSDCTAPVSIEAIVEVPISAITTLGGGKRPAQITALSAGEMMAAIRHARDTCQPQFTIVSHSFELMSRDRSKTNQIVKRRFENLCRAIAAMPGVDTATYAQSPPSVCKNTDQSVASFGPSRYLWRMVEQLASNILYGGT